VATEYKMHNSQDSNQILLNYKGQQVFIVSCAQGVKSAMYYLYCCTGNMLHALFLALYPLDIRLLAVIIVIIVKENCSLSPVNGRMVLLHIENSKK